MLKSKKKKQTIVMIEAIDGLLDDIYKTCLGVSEAWGHKDEIRTVTIDRAITIATSNTAKMKGETIGELRTNLILMLGGLKRLCNAKALEMGKQYIPTQLFAEYIRHVKAGVRKGAKIPPIEEKEEKNN